MSIRTWTSGFLRRPPQYKPTPLMRRRPSRLSVKQIWLQKQLDWRKLRRRLKWHIYWGIACWTRSSLVRGWRIIWFSRTLRCRRGASTSIAYFSSLSNVDTNGSAHFKWKERCVLPIFLLVRSWGHGVRIASEGGPAVNPLSPSPQSIVPDEEIAVAVAELRNKEAGDRVGVSKRKGELIRDSCSFKMSLAQKVGHGTSTLPEAASYEPLLPCSILPLKCYCTGMIQIIQLMIIIPRGRFCFAVPSFLFLWSPD